MILIHLLLAGFTIFCIMKLLPNIFAIMGNKAFSEGNLQKACECYRKAVEVFHGRNKIKNVYALILLKLGTFKKAEQLLTNVILDTSAKNAEKITAKTYRCMAYQKQGDLDQALEDAEELFETIKNTTIYGLIGYLCQLKGMDTLALCKEAYDYNDSDRDICDNLVVAYYRSGDIENAEKLAAKLREDYPNFTEGFYHSAMIANKKGDTKKAKEYLDNLKNCNRTMMTTVSEDEINALKEEIENARV